MTADMPAIEERLLAVAGESRVSGGLTVVCTASEDEPASQN
jgi:hypothetical protein